MTLDPIIDDVRAIRDQLAREHDYDVEALFATLRALEASSEREHRTFPPQRVSVGNAGTSEVVDPTR